MFNQIRSLNRLHFGLITRAGQSWRISQGLPRSGNELGELHDHSDWSYADGSPAPITPKQKKWMRRRAVKRARITHLLETSVYKEEKKIPPLPKE